MSSAEGAMPKSSPPARFVKTLQSLASEPVRAFTLVTAFLALILLIGYPLWMLFSKSLQSADGSLTLARYASLVTDRSLFRPFLLTLGLGAVVTLMCAGIGVPMAWVVARTNTPLKGLIRALAGVSFIIPSFMGAIAWILLLGPNTGLVNVFLRKTLGLPVTLNIFTFEGLAFVLTLHFYPLVFFGVSAALENMDPSLEEAARVSGATTKTTALRISIPLVLPALLSGALLVFLEAIAAFGAPAAIGFSAGFETLTVRIFRLIAFPPRLELAAAASMPIVALTMLGMWAQTRVLGKRQFTVVTGKSARMDRIDVGRWKYVLLAFCLIFLGIALVLPAGYMALASLVRIWGAEFHIANLTLANYTSLWNPEAYVAPAIRNSLALGLGAAVASAAVGLIVAWIVERIRPRGSGALASLAMLPFAFPGMAFGVGLIIAYTQPWLNLYGTVWLLLIAYIAKYISLAFTFIRNGLRQLTPEFEEAARMAGASWVLAMRRITVPLLSGALVVGLTMVFSLVLRELSMSILLVLPGSETMAVAIFWFLQDGYFEKAAALSIVVGSVAVLSVGIVRWLGGRPV
ncbi:MAG TPA: iron ABC transporter permease [Candidatus Methylomirabilis sp.]|nr:iron ABC transporter permease [Candidatus Methylomirabilis sp.]